MPPPAAGIVFSWPVAMAVVMGALAVNMTIQVPGTCYSRACCPAWLPPATNRTAAADHRVARADSQPRPPHAQYWLARTLLHARVVRMLASPKRDGLALLLRAADMAGPYKTVALLRLGPFPYGARRAASFVSCRHSSRTCDALAATL